MRVLLPELPAMQLDLFSHVASAYADAPGGRLTNKQFYQAVAVRAGISIQELHEKTPIGDDGKLYSLVHRKCGGAAVASAYGYSGARGW